MKQRTPSTRAAILTRRTYNRPIDGSETVFETWEQTVYRVIVHQKWLWERQKGCPLDTKQLNELKQLQELMLQRKALTSGRTLWLGGTSVAKEREASQFNCSFAEVQTVHDMVDAIWLLLQGCGIGSIKNPGILNGFSKKIEEIVVVRSDRTEKGGRESNQEVVTHNPTTIKTTWTISIGDSAEAWAKAFGKLIAGKHVVDRLIIDCSEIRPAGERLKGYGWISSGDEALAKAMVGIAGILNERAGELLTRIDIHENINWLGTVLSSRRSAEIMLHRYNDPEWEEFTTLKRNAGDKVHLYQSNNSLLFHAKPSRLELRGIFNMMLEGGGSEPGFINAVAAEKRAPWFRGVNPCAEILLGNKSFCNLVETNLSAFNGDHAGLHRAHRLVARANYRQTCVNLKDGVLQDTWHELNEFLRLCGVGVTGIVGWENADTPSSWQLLRHSAVSGACSMADELGLPRPKLVTTVKPSGTLSKIMDTTEGVHKPMGRYIFNNVNFGKHDPLIPVLRDAGYRVVPNPTDPDALLVTFPVAWEDIEFTEVEHDGKTLHINTESAVDQLNRYKMLMDNYVDHNCSITVSYDPSEIPEITEWLDTNWDTYVGVSWLLRVDPTKSAEDIGYPYLPQEVVTKDAYEAYANTLKPINIDRGNSHDLIDAEECVGGVCPVR